MCDPKPAQRCASHQRNKLDASAEKLLQAGDDPEARAKYFRRAAAEAEKWLWTHTGIAYLHLRGYAELSEKLENYRQWRKRMVEKFNNDIAGIQDPATKRARIREMDESLDRAAPPVPPTLVASLVDHAVRRQKLALQEKARQERRKARIAADLDPSTPCPCNWRICWCYQ